MYADTSSWWLSGKESACNSGAAGDTSSSPGSDDPLEKGMTTHSSTLAWTEDMDRGAGRAAVQWVTESQT